MGKEEVFMGQFYENLTKPSQLLSYIHLLDIQSYKQNVHQNSALQEVKTRLIPWLIPYTTAVLKEKGIPEIWLNSHFAQ